MSTVAHEADALGFGWMRDKSQLLWKISFYGEGAQRPGKIDCLGVYECRVVC